MAVLVLIMSILLAMTTEMSKLWSTTTGKIEQFRGARDGFETMTRHLSQATLNTYWDYNNEAAPTSYIRQSELRFMVGKTETLAGQPTAPKRWPTYGVFFQAPLGFSEQSSNLGLENLLNTWGYYLEFTDDSAERPAMITTQIAAPRYRYRLMELMEPSESLSLYRYTSGLGLFQSGLSNNSLYLSSSPPSGYTGKEWFTTPLSASLTHVLAENVIALIILPKLSTVEEQSLQTAGTIPSATIGTSLAPQYSYDSTALNSNAALNPKNQLPPEVQITMVAIDEASAIRLAQVNGTTMPDLGQSSLFTTASNMTADLATLQQTLTSQHINFHVFTTSVGIAGAKWSSDEQN